MNTLYLDRQNSTVQLDGDVLIIRHTEGQRLGTVPVQQIERLVIRANTLIETRCLARLGEMGVGVLLLQGRRPKPTLMVPRRHHDTVRRLAQYRASFDTAICLRMARGWVGEKLRSQISTLALLQQSRPDARRELEHALRALRKLRESIDAAANLECLRGLEGAAARSEFAAYAALLPASLGFHGRNRRPPRDPYNALISLAYTLLYGEAQLAAHCVGLDPAAGFYHQPGFAHDALASDLMEPERPHINFWAQQAFAHQRFRSADFRITEHGCMLGKAARGRFYQSWEHCMESLRGRLNERGRSLIRTLGMDSSAAHVGIDEPLDGEHPEADIDLDIDLEPAAASDSAAADLPPHGEC